MSELGASGPPLGVSHPLTTRELHALTTREISEYISTYYKSLEDELSVLVEMAHSQIAVYHTEILALSDDTSVVATQISVHLEEEISVLLDFLEHVHEPEVILHDSHQPQSDASDDRDFRKGLSA